MATMAVTAKEYLKSDHKSVANGKEVEENDATLDSKKRKRDIADCINRPRKLSSSNEDKEAEGKEEDVSATQASIEDNPPINK